MQLQLLFVYDNLIVLHSMCKLTYCTQTMDSKKQKKACRSDRGGEKKHQGFCDAWIEVKNTNIQVQN